MSSKTEVSCPVPPTRATCQTARALLAACLVVLAGSSFARAEAPTHHHVLVLHSFGENVSPFAEVASAFEEELSRLSPRPVEFFEASLESVRFTETSNEDALVHYLRALFSQEPLDLVVAMGGPASRFAIRQRETLFPQTPLLVAGVERRWVKGFDRAGNTAAAPVEIDPAAAVENILRLLPETEQIVVVLGDSPNSRLWRAETERDFRRFAPVRFVWTNDWTLQQMQTRLADLPPRTAVFFGELSVDADGILYPTRTAFATLHEAANAPIFGLFDSELGQGIVGGPLLSLSESGKCAASAAFQLLKGKAPNTIASELVTMNRLAYDFRELERWGIGESRLPPGSQVLYRTPSAWERYRWPAFVGLSIVGLQTVLIGGLLVQRRHRRVAEDEARALSRRLLTAHEDERRHLARELHDDLSQRLARLAIDAARVERSSDGSPRTSAANEMRDELVRMSEDVHALSYQLHPSILHDLGLKEALQEECDRFSRRESIASTLVSTDSLAELPSDVAVCLFRIAQGALRNVARHAVASSVRIAISRTNGRLTMNVSDDGIGFEPARHSPRSLGLASMRERASLIEGTVEVESAPGRGTTVHVVVPVKEGAR